jgi:hypothetical protein
METAGFWWKRSAADSVRSHFVHGAAIVDT